MESPLQQCANCDRLIGRLEEHRQFQQHIVCAACYDMLEAAYKSVAAAPASMPTPQATLNYATPLSTTPRPKWVYAVVGIYTLLLAGFGALPLITATVSSKRDAGVTLILALFVGIFLVAGGLLIIVPVRSQWQNAISRRAIWYPLTGSLILFAVLCLAAGMATSELLEKDQNTAGLVAIGLAILWIGWFVFFWLLSRSLDPLSFSVRIYKSLIVGSIAELAVAVPMHLVVRRRTECCAGMMTGMAICLGALTSIIAIGPGIYFLYKRRWNEVYRDHRTDKKARPI